MLYITAELQPHQDTMASSTVLHEKDAVPLADVAAPDRETSYTEPASHLVPDDPVKVELDVTEQEIELEDIFKPLPPLPGIPAEPNPLTFRAIVTGTVLGSLVNAANVYLGLKTGFTFGSSMFGAIFGYGFVKLLSTTFAGVPILGMPFGPQVRRPCGRGWLGCSVDSILTT